jgi:hypothetical protein
MFLDVPTIFAVLSLLVATWLCAIYVRRKRRIVGEPKFAAECRHGHPIGGRELRVCLLLTPDGRNDSESSNGKAGEVDTVM